MGVKTVCIDLLSSLHYGLLRMVDRETQHGGSPATLLATLAATHGRHPCLAATDAATFTIRHFAASVTYSAGELLETNRDTMADDLVQVFRRPACSSGFVSHLFAVELRHLASEEAAPRGVHYRLGPTSPLELPTCEQPSSTLGSDLLTRLDGLLRQLLHSRLHFVLCLAPSRCGDQAWDQAHVVVSPASPSPDLQVLTC